MGILFTILIGFLLTITMGILFTIVLGIQFTISIANPEQVKGDYRVVLSSIKREKNLVSLKFLITPPKYVDLHVRILDDHGNRYSERSEADPPRNLPTIPDLTFSHDVRIDVPEVAKLKTVEIWQKEGDRKDNITRLSFNTGVFVQPKFKDYGDIRGKPVQAEHYLSFIVDGLKRKEREWVIPITIENKDYNYATLQLGAIVQYLDGTFDDEVLYYTIPYLKPLSKEKVLLKVKPSKKISEVRNIIISYVKRSYSASIGEKIAKMPKKQAALWLNLYMVQQPTVPPAHKGHLIWTIKTNQER